MTKLQEWLAAACVLVSIWFYLIVCKENNAFVSNNYTLILYSPIIFVFLFGLYAAGMVLYRTFTFNDCEEASIELQKEIEEAKDELRKMGFVFKEKPAELK